MLIIVLDKGRPICPEGFFCKVDDFLEEMYSKRVDLFFYYLPTSNPSFNSLWIRDPFNNLFISVEERMVQCGRGIGGYQYRVNKICVNEHFSYGVKSSC